MELAASQQVASRKRRSAGLRGKWPKWFIVSSGAILLVTGLAKVASAFGNAKFLDLPDPVMGIPFRYFLPVVGIVELFVGVICLFGSRPKLCMGLVLWLAMDFVGYRAGAWLVGWEGACPCMGSLTDVLHLSTQTADLIMRGVLAYLLAGCCAWFLPLINKWINSRRTGKSGLRTLLLSALLICQSFAYAAQTPIRTSSHDYTVKGLYEQKLIRYSFLQKTYYYEFVTNGFELYVTDCRWLMKLGTKDSKVYDCCIVSSDGENTYLLLDYETRLKATGKTNLNVGDGTVTKGNVPCFVFAEEAGAIWLAYASACRLSERTHDARQIMPFANYVRPRPVGPGSPPALEQSARVLSDHPPYLPRLVTYYVKDLAAVGFNVQTQLSTGHPFTNVFYQALSFSDVDGFRFPKEAIVSVYRPDPQHLSDIQAQLCEEYRLILTNAVVGVSLASFKPELPGNTLISDWRFTDAGVWGLAYFATNDWLDENVVRNSKGYREALRNIHTGGPKPATRFVVRWAFVVLLFFPLVVWRFLQKAPGSPEI
jgi:hypothetical protein